MSSTIYYHRDHLPLASTSMAPASAIPGRKCWKKTKERTEAVWSPALETALIEALEKYRPTSCRRNTRPLLRFPRRNQFISDYIFSVTGTRRSAKQVGSRLQQLRDTCVDERILNLIYRRESGGDSAMESHSPAPLDDFSSTAPSPDASTSDISDIMSVGSRTPRTFVTIELIHPSGNIRHERISSSPGAPNHHCVSLEYPSNIEANDPILAFSTSRRISTRQHYSYFRVFIGGVLAHTEATELTFASTSFTPAEQHTYNTNLIPHFWVQLCRTEKLFQCAIEQDIMKTPTPFDILPTSPSPSDQTIRSVIYEFSVLRTTAPAFCPPSLPSDPLLPPEFPGVRYTSRPSSKTPFEEGIAFYAPDGSFIVPAQDCGLFSGTSFFQDMPANPASSTLPYVQSAPYSTSHDNTHYSEGLPYGSSSDSNQWPRVYDTYVATTNAWSNAPMYSELYNSDAF
ncbi:TEA domain-containing protein [Mycena venus]|uniref:TEA domain-containing protein n=1 Tax=Mycena venus TaxID=2733690 RepID=A0A8H6XS62_9AGAR|nr:TEA domain-containing protein [Mycena venus]